MSRFMDAVRVMTRRQITAEELYRAENGNGSKRNGNMVNYRHEGKGSVVAHQINPGFLSRTDRKYFYTPQGFLEKKEIEEYDMQERFMRRVIIVYEPAGRLWGRKLAK